MLEINMIYFDAMNWSYLLFQKRFYSSYFHEWKKKLHLIIVIIE